MGENHADGLSRLGTPVSGGAVSRGDSSNPRLPLVHRLRLRWLAEMVAAEKSSLMEEVRLNGKCFAVSIAATEEACS